VAFRAARGLSISAWFASSHRGGRVADEGEDAKAYQGMKCEGSIGEGVELRQGSFQLLGSGIGGQEIGVY